MFRFPRLTPFVKKLLIGLFTMFVVVALADNWVGLGLFNILALTPANPGIQSIWQLVTYVAVTPPLPNAVFGFMITLLFLWLIMAPFEERFGSRRTMQLTLVATLSASLPALAVGLLAPGIGGALFGANPVLVATIAAYAYSLPKNGVLNFFGVMPMKPIHLIYLVLGLSLLSFIVSKNVIGLVADLGAVGGGILFVRWMRRPRTPKRPPPKKRRDVPFTVIQGGNDDDRPRWLN